MAHRLVCDCGFVVAEEDVDRFVSLAQDHALSAHQVELSAEQILRLDGQDRSMTTPGQLDGDTPTRVRPPPGATTDEEG